jgi:hypothetical protein
MGEVRNPYKIVVENLKGRDLYVDWRIILKLFLEEYDTKM